MHFACLAKQMDAAADTCHHDASTALGLRSAHSTMATEPLNKPAKIEVITLAIAHMKKIEDCQRNSAIPGRSLLLKSTSQTSWQKMKKRIHQSQKTQNTIERCGSGYSATCHSFLDVFRQENVHC